MTKNLTKIMLVLGALALVILALIAIRPVDGKVVAADPTATPAPSPTPVPFTGQADVVAMYPAMGVVNPDTARAAGVTAARSDDPTKTYAVFSPGMKNVPPGVPVYVQAGAISLADKATLKSFDWTLKGPDGSAAKIAKVDKPVPGLSADMATFTPDKEGEYLVGITVTDSAGKKSVAGELKVTAAKYVGNEVCKGCHKDQYEGWSKTAHGTAFNRYVSMNVEAEYWSAGFSCARCHTVGYYPVAGTGGWWDTFVNTLKLTWNKGEFTVTTKDANGKDVQTKYNSIAEAIAFNGSPDFSAVDDKGAVVNGPVFGSMPAQLQAVSNIGCESCHGPAGAHVAKPGLDTAPVTSADSSSCIQCHNGGGHHTRGEAIQNSLHSQNASLEEGDRTPCNTCHSAEGFADIAAGVDPAKARAVNSDIGCAACHDPHSEKNTFQLRMVDNVTIPNAAGIEPTAKITDAGLSAVCMTCHNNRTNPNDAKAGVAVANPGPHYSSAAEQLAGVGGYTFGATIQNGFHGNIGKAPLTDEAGNALNGGAAPGSCVLCHMAQTPGGVGNTAATLKLPGHQTIGGHSFNMVDEADKAESIAVCQQCHPGIKDFNFAAPADYTGDGKAEGVQSEMKTLLDMTYNAMVTKASGEGLKLYKVASRPYIQVEDAKDKTKKATPSTELKAAIYNYRYVYGLMWSGTDFNTGGLGKSAAIHNFQYSAGLLQVTIEKMTGKPLGNATLLYTLPKKK